MNGWLIFGGCAATTITVGRVYYARMRAHEIASSASGNFDFGGQMFLGFMALLCGLVWPLSLLVLIITAKPRKSPKELENEKRDRIAHVKRIETELERDLQWELARKNSRLL